MKRADPVELRNCLDLACSLAKEAGARFREVTFGTEAVETDFKGSVDLLTEYDLWAEKLITDAVTSKYPSHVIVGEESSDPDKVGREKTIERALPNGICWIIDPIDGTTNFVSRLPHYSISIGIAVDGEPVAGVVYNPPRDELFTAFKGEGAFLNGRPIKVSAKSKLVDALVATGFPYERRKVWPQMEDRFKAVLLACRDIRRWGAASLDCCYVACGRFDAYFESTVAPWDIAAGHLIVSEAGGKGQSYLKAPGSPFQLPCSTYACGSGESFVELIECIQSQGNPR